MEKNSAVVQQAYYGEVNRGHSCISQTINDPELTSSLISFTDRPAALPPGTELTPYLSGGAFLSYYVFTKTFPDPFASRAGMVFTHALIFNLHDIEAIDNIDNILDMFFDEVPKEKKELKAFTLENFSNKLTKKNKFQPRFIQQSISSLVNGVCPLLFSGSVKAFEGILNLIWGYHDTEYRKKFRFRTSFTPSDIQETNDLTIVYIQKELLSKWPEKVVVKSENDEVIEIVSLSELLFLGYREENPFCSFLIELNVALYKFKEFGKFYEVFSDFIVLDKIVDADQLRKNIRILSKECPSKECGIQIKDKFINRLEELICNGIDTNLKALRNIEWDAFSNGEMKVRNMLSLFIGNEIRKSNEVKIELLSELINISFKEGDGGWWHSSIQESFKTVFLSHEITVYINIWKILGSSEVSLEHLFILMPVSKGTESSLRECIPAQIKKENIKFVEMVSRNNSWYLLHADILLKYLKADIAILKQLDCEKNLKLSDSIGVEYIFDKMDSIDKIDLAISSRDSKLIQLVVKLALKNKSIFEHIDLEQSGWLDVWVGSIVKTQDISYGIKGKEIDVIHSFMGYVIDGNNVSEIVFDLIVRSTFSDLSNYSNRAECWSKIPLKFKDKFLDVTAKSIISKFLLDEINISSIEAPLVDQITSDSFMTFFLNENKDDIEAVIKLFDAFGNLKDEFLSDYVKYFCRDILDDQSVSLGVLVLKYGFRKTARSIYDKSKYNRSFKLALVNCQTLVNLNWWESIVGGHSNSFETKQIKGYQHENSEDEVQMRRELPTVVVLTAIKEEYLAVREHLEDIADADNNDTSYEAGIFKFNEKEIAKIIIRECGATNTIASQESERAIQYFKPDCMFFVGIAGSRKPNDFSVGDVIFPNKIYSYEAGKSEKNSFKARPDFANTCFTLIELAKKERRKEDWKNLIKNTYEDDVKADLGVIASGEQIVEHYSSEIGKILSKYFNDTSVVEMEGFGFAKAASRQGRQTKDIMVGLVRGISDIIDQPKLDNEKASMDRRPENAKKFASDTAAAFAFWLIFKLYE